ncbi:XdhC family protein [Gordonia sp. TBRC 11910]|uniref:XdhC family protein n=1 Tax=Gordonia asplenii TaxID=2725283 RepID=A0A848L7Q1_9ACTN|nr:XdhC/CoxI family protein [Gordonia asplenii]NMO05015.1 XdhC family protein [Gordonia asplenii]
MRTVLGQLIAAASLERVALARVITARGPGPCPAGTAMVITASGEVIGCLSGGCIDADVVARAATVIADGVATSMWFGADQCDPLGLRPTLTCGGEIEVFVEPVDADAVALLRRLANALREGVEVDWVTELGERPRWFLGPRAAGMASAPAFHQYFPPAPRMILTGANGYVGALCAMAIQLDYRVTVVDARSAFTTADRFPGADVVVEWPQRYLGEEVAAGRIDPTTVICVLSHDERFDVPTLRIALDSAAGFVGALGSRRTHRTRLARLLEDGVAVQTLARLHSPLGLDLNAQTPAQTAVSILAQIVAETRGGTSVALGARSGPIHREVG